MFWIPLLSPAQEEMEEGISATDGKVAQWQAM